jgi:hypothetical protein
MRTWLPLLLLTAVAGFANDGAFNGRWNIQVLKAGQERQWWLDVDGAGTASPGGSFVGAPGGGCDKIDDLAIRNGELSFSFERKYRLKRGEHAVLAKGIYKAHLVKGSLEGTYTVEGSEEPAVKWVGMRAPVIKDKDDGTWREGKPVQLFDGKDLRGWTDTRGRQLVKWAVENGVLKSELGAPNIISTQKFWNFKVHIEYRIGADGNSGLGLRNRYEIQMADSFGHPVESHINGAVYSRIPPSTNASKPADEWQSLDVRLIGRDVTVVLNGVKVVDRQVIIGPTAIVGDPHEDQPGPIFLQGDHKPVEVRSLVVTPLLKQ